MRGIPQALQELIEHGVIDAVACPLKSGKEADLFIVESGSKHYVAKVYKERKFRSFKNDAGYREGRKVGNTRSQRALDRGTKYGQQLAQTAWHNAEVDALRVLEQAGANVPQVHVHGDGVLVMEMISDQSGNPAPQLAQVDLSPEGALAIYDAILQQVVHMLLNDLVHGDLSPYNVLVRDGQPVLIDMPQCVSAAHNQQAGMLLERDVKAISQYLGLAAPEIVRLGDAAWQLWEEYERGALVPGFRPDPNRERATEISDLAGLAHFVRSATAEGDLERRASEGDEGAIALLRAADRRAAKRTRSAAAAAAAEQEAGAAEARAARRSKKSQQKTNNRTRGPRRRTPTPSVANTAKTPIPAKQEVEGEAPKSKRRRRRRRKGGGGRARRHKPSP